MRRRSRNKPILRAMLSARGVPQFQPTIVFTPSNPWRSIRCPTGEICKHACACSGVSASGIVGVGAKCKCIAIAKPPNPPLVLRLPYRWG